MTTIYSCLVERRNFGDLLSAEGVMSLSPTITWGLASIVGQYLGDHTVQAVWAREPSRDGELPVLLVCRDGTEEDWAGWITTFGAKIRPFSAFMRLVERSALEDFSSERDNATLERLLWPIAGLVLGEVLAASGLPDKSLEMMPANACESTLSFALFRAFAVQPGFRRTSQLIDSWQAARQLTRQQPRSIETAAIAKVCGAVIDAARLSDVSLLESEHLNLVRACRELIEEPDSAPRTLYSIPQFRHFEGRMRGSREDRVIALSEFVRDLGESSPIESELTSFLLGYLASRIAPGTIQHSEVLRPVTLRYSTALLWYGFFAGFGEVKQGVRKRSLELPVTARRVARDLTNSENILTRPRSDLAYSELVALSRTGADPLASITRSTQGTALIELTPGVSTSVNVLQRVSSEDFARPVREREILSDMGHHIDALAEAYERLAKGNSELTQQDLFPRRRKKH